MIEEEAKTKICHKSMVPVATMQNDVIVNTTNCIGSACMAWRSMVVGWHNKENRALRPGEVVLKDDVDQRALSTFGYCGLAGAP